MSGSFVKKLQSDALWVLPLIVALAVGFVGWECYRPGPHKQATTILVKKGMGLGVIAQTLKQAGVVRQPQLFKLHGRILGYDKNIKAGEYELTAGLNGIGIYKLLASGKVKTYAVTIPEGFSTFQIRERLLGAEALAGAVPDEKDIGEGTLLPDTYYFTRGDSRAAIVKRMRKAQALFLDKLWQLRDKSLPYKNIQEAVTMASLIEKETSLPEERTVVSAVLIKRLKKRMALQSDPSVIYALAGGKPLGRELLREEYKLKHPYNTYRQRGLPPGPICNPGRASLEAAFKPAEVNYLYFVADGKGGHIFTNSYQQHLKNSAKLFKLKKQERAEERAEKRAQERAAKQAAEKAASST